ncbi:MAG: response regulator transcription factor [Micrococcales bacterium]|nr:response regulator transcription factor [Micrococcales bacterium]
MVDELTDEVPPIVRVLVVDDQVMVRLGFVLVLGNEPGLEVVGEAGDGRTAVTMTRALRPDVVLMDIRMPGLDGIAATRQILADPETSATKVVVLTTFDDEEYVFESLAAGASGFLLKDVEPQGLVDAVRQVVRGDRLLAPAVTRQVVSRYIALERSAREGGESPSDQGQALAEALSPRELEIWLLLAEGHSNRRIARTLGITENTVKGHVSALLVKLGVVSRVQAVVLAYRAGIVR